MLELTSQEREPIALTRTMHISDLFGTVIEARRADPQSLIGYGARKWPCFTECCGGFRPGEVISLTADTGVGKSTFALNWLLDSVFQDRRCFLISLEERWQATALRLATMTLERNFMKADDIQVGTIGTLWRDAPLWLLSAHGPQKDELILRSLEHAAKEKGCMFAVIDHLDYIERTYRPQEGDSAIIGHFMRRLCGVAHACEMAIVVICHPKKLETRGLQNREIGMDEMKGSSSIKQESDMVFSLYQPDRGKNDTILRFQKVRSPRYSRNTGAFVRFHFNYDSLWLEERSTHAEWGDVRA